MVIDIEIVKLMVVGLFGLSFLIQCYYLFFVFGKLAFYKKKESATATPPTSIIVCARNEEKNLIENLPGVLSQDYPLYEVVVVDDCSYDNTADILDEFEKKHAHLKVVTIKEDEHYSHGKKFAVMVGIKGAKYENLLFIDADCKPASKFWLKNMVSNFSETKKIILGYGAYEKKGGIFNKFLRFDGFMIAMQYLSLALAKKPYMGVGRNLAYTKTLFFANKGFATHYHIESGDDDLFVNEVANSTNCAVEVSHDSITLTAPKKTFASFIKQKRRHVTTFSHYTAKSKFYLYLLGFGEYLFWLSFIALLCLQYEIYVILGVFGFRMLIQMIIFRKAMIRLNEKDLFWLLPIYELSLLIFYPLLGFTKMFTRKNKWKV